MGAGTANAAAAARCSAGANRLKQQAAARSRSQTMPSMQRAASRDMRHKNADAVDTGIRFC